MEGLCMIEDGFGLAVVRAPTPAAVLFHDTEPECSKALQRLLVHLNGPDATSTLPGNAPQQSQPYYEDYSDLLVDSGSSESFTASDSSDSDACPPTMTPDAARTPATPSYSYYYHHGHESAWFPTTAATPLSVAPCSVFGTFDGDLGQVVDDEDGDDASVPDDVQHPATPRDLRLVVRVPAATSSSTPSPCLTSTSDLGSGRSDDPAEHAVMRFLAWSVANIVYVECVDRGEPPANAQRLRLECYTANYQYMSEVNDEFKQLGHKQVVTIDLMARMGQWCRLQQQAYIAGDAGAHQREFYRWFCLSMVKYSGLFLRHERIAVVRRLLEFYHAGLLHECVTKRDRDAARFAMAFEHRAGQQVADHLREYEDRCLWRYLWSPHPRGAACNGNLRLRVDFPLPTYLPALGDIRAQQVRAAVLAHVPACKPPTRKQAMPAAGAAKSRSKRRS